MWYLMTVLIALKSALPLIPTSFNPHVNCTLVLTATNFHGLSTSAASAACSISSGAGAGARARDGLGATPPDAIRAAAAAAAVAAIAGCTLLNLISKNHKMHKQTHTNSRMSEDKWVREKRKEICLIIYSILNVDLFIKMSHKKSHTHTQVKAQVRALCSTLEGVLHTRTAFFTAYTHTHIDPPTLSSRSTPSKHTHTHACTHTLKKKWLL